MRVGIAKETFPGESRVALVPSSVPRLVKAGLQVVVEHGAGAEAGFRDDEYKDKGASTGSRDDVFAADAVLQVRSLGANLEAGRADLNVIRSGQVIIGMCDPLGQPQAVRDLAEAGATVFALEIIPRITRAQSMDVLSSMATIAGYRAVLLAAAELPRMFPMVTFAAGMLRPAKVFVIGAGVAGLRAIATAKQLGAVVQAHDIRPTSREEVQSVGAKFVELELDADTQDAGGYAKQLTDADYDRQRELIADVAAESDIIITTAAIPGRRSPLLVTAKAVQGMSPGSVIVDLAAERGGNCELTQADQRIVEHGVTILGPTNTPSEVPNDASTMYSNNLTRLLLAITKDGELVLDMDDEIISGTLVAHQGEVTHPRLREMLELPPLPERKDQQEEEPPTSQDDPTAPIPFDSEDSDEEKPDEDQPPQDTLDESNDGDEESQLGEDNDGADAEKGDPS